MVTPAGRHTFQGREKSQRTPTLFLIPQGIYIIKIPFPINRDQVATRSRYSGIGIRIFLDKYSA